MELSDNISRLKIALEEQQNREAQRLFYRLYPEHDTPWRGPSILKGLISPGQILFSRHKYAKHLEFFRLGETCRERCFMAANRVGKTLGGGYEIAAHLTGEYPAWWEGRRFHYPVSIWVAGETYTTTRDILQQTLVGQYTTIRGRQSVDGRGIIPGARLGRPSWNRHVPEALDKIAVEHVTGGFSSLQFKSYQEGREKFQGTGQHVVLLDEEPSAAIYGEALMRTATLDGLAMLTFTPLKGMSDVVQSFVAA